MTRPENILCVPRQDLPAEWVGAEVSLAMSAAAFFGRLSPVTFAFKPRPELECNPDFKQFIPYLLVQTPDGHRTACYRRNGSEKRLHALWSVGIGGHISDADCAAPHASLEQIVDSGLHREIAEEFRSLPTGPPPRFHGIVNEERTEVGSVHLGLVYRLAVDNPLGVIAGEELCDFRWMESSVLFRLTLELWSRLALRLIGLEHPDQGDRT